MADNPVQLTRRHYDFGDPEAMAKLFHKMRQKLSERDPATAACPWDDLPVSEQILLVSTFALLIAIRESHEGITR